MTDQENNQEAVDQNVEQDQQVEAQEEQKSATPDKYAIDYREIRKSKEKAEKERDEAYKLLQQIKQQQEAASKVTEEPVEEDLSISVNDDDFVEGKDLGKVTKKIKNLEKQLENYKQASTAATAESQLRAKYKDFDKVVNKENIEALTKDYPELGNTLRSSTDIYSQAVSAYKMIKQFGIYQEDKYVEDKAKAEENAAKPRPLASVSPQQGEGPLTRANAFANGLTDELKAQLLKEMNDARSKM